MKAGKTRKESGISLAVFASSPPEGDILARLNRLLDKHSPSEKKGECANPQAVSPVSSGAAAADFL
jgi:hypothetical protein